MNESIEIPLLKIITLGNSSVGKTSIIKQYTNKTFEADQMNTIGIDLKTHNTTIENIPIKLKIWDTAGQERFRSIQKQYYKEVDGVLFIYDITNRESFDIIPEWLENVKEIVNENIIGVFLGNKSDLFDSRVVSYEEGEILGKKYNFKFFETSAVNGNYIDDAFYNLIYEIMKKKNLINKNDKIINSYEVLEKDYNNKDDINVYFDEGKNVNEKQNVSRNSFHLNNNKHLNKNQKKKKCC